MMAKHHYDHDCRAASSVGGMVFGWMNRLSAIDHINGGDPYSIEVAMSFREADLICKICENTQVLMKPVRGSEVRAIEEFVGEIHTAMRQINDKHAVIRDTWRMDLEKNEFKKDEAPRTHRDVKIGSVTFQKGIPCETVFAAAERVGRMEMAMRKRFTLSEIYNISNAAENPSKTATEKDHGH